MFKCHRVYMFGLHNNIRNTFYKRIAWVVNGRRRKKDLAKFQKAIDQSPIVNKKPLILQVKKPEESVLIEDWHNSQSLVFFDFNALVLWFLFPKTQSNHAYVGNFPRGAFVETFVSNNIDEDFVSGLLSDIAKYEKSRRIAPRPKNH